MPTICDQYRPLFRQTIQTLRSAFVSNEQLRFASLLASRVSITHSGLLISPVYLVHLLRINRLYRVAHSPPCSPIINTRITLLWFKVSQFFIKKNKAQKSALSVYLHIFLIYLQSTLSSTNPKPKGSCFFYRR
jgi:hypothetical protein